MFTYRHKTKMFTAFRAIAKHTSCQSWSASHPSVQALPSLGALASPSKVFSPSLCCPGCLPPLFLHLEALQTSLSTSTVCPHLSEPGTPLTSPLCLSSIPIHPSSPLCLSLSQTLISGHAISLLHASYCHCKAPRSSSLLVI